MCTYVPQGSSHSSKCFVPSLHSYQTVGPLLIELLLLQLQGLYKYILKRHKGYEHDMYIRMYVHEVYILKQSISEVQYYCDGCLWRLAHVE